MSEVLTAREGAVLTITLNRPEVFNAFNAPLHAALADALAEAAAPDVRAVVITGAGKGFCAGQDLKEFREIEGTIRERLESTYHPNIRAIRALEKPVLAAGPTRGIAMTKRLFDNTDHATLAEQLALEADLQTEMTKTDDFKEGVAAFLEKRPPNFSGR
jgi:enoyl-CoA hydratase/carnithine racemase